MIVRYIDGRAHVDREALAMLAKRSTETIRKRCVAVDRDPSGRPLYDALACLESLEPLATRRRNPAA